MARPPQEVPPLKNAGSVPRQPPPAGEVAGVLVVDDNPGKLGSLAAVVEGMGLEVVTAASGRDALRRLLKRDFAVILLDVKMPAMDGFETASLVRNRPRSAHTPIIFVTAEAVDDADRTRGYALGAVDYIPSPIVPEILRAKVQVFVDLYYLNHQLERQARELQQHGEEITRKNIQLEAASRTKSEFLANMSHELRTPLNAIIGFSEVLKDGLAGALNEEQQQFVTEIFTSGHHLLALINDILDLSKVEAGKMSIEPERLEIAPLLKASFNVVKEKAMKHRIRLKLDLAPLPAQIYADGRKLKQIIYNLVSNAVKFAPDGGEVRLAARVAKRDEVWLAPPPGWVARQLPLPETAFQDFLEITVRDNGPGIDADDLQRLFQMFMQLDSSLARNYEGTGLGLALVRRMVELQGGTVAVASAVGKGSSFSIWLPWRLEPEATASPPAAQESAAADAEATGSAATAPLALVIEDDDQSAAILRTHLESIGLRVVRAADAAGGQALAAKEHPDLITLDILLPDQEGWELLERLKADSALASVPVVIVSVAADKSLGFALGAVEVLQKPVARETLLAAISDLGLAGGKQAVVLVVDDDPGAVELVATHLKELNCKVLRAYGGRKGIEKARCLRPDLVILDLMMPDVSGFDVVETLQSRAETAAVPIVVLTGKAVTGEERERLNRHVVNITAKHRFDRSEFLAEVRRALCPCQNRKDAHLPVRGDGNGNNTGH